MVYTAININQASPALQRGLQDGVRLNQEARELSARGDYAGAERLHTQALSVKLKNLGMNHASTAISYNALGEVCIKLRKLDEAEDYLKKAVGIGDTFNPPFDRAYYRENLAQVYEMRGQLAKASDVRLESAPDHMICSYENVCVVCPCCKPYLMVTMTQCPTTALFRRQDLSMCSRCRVSSHPPIIIIIVKSLVLD